MKELIESKWQEILNILVKEHEISEVAVYTWITTNYSDNFG